VTPQFIAAGILALAAAAIHGGAGEVVVLRPLFAGELPSSRFGGPGATRVMIRVTWHVVSLTFAAFGLGLTTCGLLGPSEACRGIGLVGASLFTAFVALSAIVVWQRPRAAIRHRGPLVFLAIAALAWWGLFASGA
jgi:hypothetical protein